MRSAALYLDHGTCQKTGTLHLYVEIVLSIAPSARQCHLGSLNYTPHATPHTHRLQLLQLVARVLKLGQQLLLYKLCLARQRRLLQATAPPQAVSNRSAR